MPSLLIDMTELNPCEVYGTNGNDNNVASCQSNADGSRTISCAEGFQAKPLLQSQQVTLTAGEKFEGCAGEEPPTGKK